MLLHNANLKGFFTGKIYGGPLKSVCVPGLNCYSCPGAVGACPIGSLQSFLGALRFRFPYYVIGMLVFFGAVLGRTVCGFLCPFGWLQELLNAVPLLRKTDRFALDKPLRCLKYVVLALLLILPLFVKLTPFFCKYVCPAGTLSGALLAVSDALVRSRLGGLFTWKPARRDLRFFQPRIPAPPAPGGEPLRRLRKVRRGLPDERGPVPGAGQRRMRPLREVCGQMSNGRPEPGVRGDGAIE